MCLLHYSLSHLSTSTGTNGPCVGVKWSAVNESVVHPLGRVVIDCGISFTLQLYDSVCLCLSVHQQNSKGCEVVTFTCHSVCILLYQITSLCRPVCSISFEVQQIKCD